MTQAIRYRIYSIIDIPVDDVEGLQETLEKIQERGATEILQVELLDSEDITIPRELKQDLQFMLNKEEDR